MKLQILKKLNKKNKKGIQDNNNYYLNKLKKIRIK